MAVSLSIPREQLPAFQQFRRDFDLVTGVWMERGEETSEAVEEARDALRGYIADESDPDEFGLSRAGRLDSLFAFWRGLAVTNGRRAAAVVPVMSFASEVRAADAAWKRRGMK